MDNPLFGNGSRKYSEGRKIILLDPVNKYQKWIIKEVRGII